MAIQVQLSDETWKFINKEKNAGETFDEVIQRLLKIKKEVKK